MSSTVVQPAEWLQALQAHGFRVTPTKEALLVLLTQAAFPMSAEKAWEFVRGEHPNNGRATVFRLFDMRAEIGFLRHVHGLNHCNQYVLAQNSERPLFVCISYGKADFLADDALHLELQALTRQSGYRLHAVHIQLLGMCSVCQSS